MACSASWIIWLPVSAFELCGQMQTEVDGGDAVAGERHLHALCLPVGQRILVASDVDGVREVLAA